MAKLKNKHIVNWNLITIIFTSLTFIGWIVSDVTDNDSEVRQYENKIKELRGDLMGCKKNLNYQWYTRFLKLQNQYIKEVPEKDSIINSNKSLIDSLSLIIEKRLNQNASKALLFHGYDEDSLYGIDHPFDKEGFLAFAKSSEWGDSTSVNDTVAVLAYLKAFENYEGWIQFESSAEDQNSLFLAYMSKKSFWEKFSRIKLLSFLFAIIAIIASILSWKRR